MTDIQGNMVKAVHIKIQQVQPPFVNVTTAVLEHWNEKWNEIGEPLQYGQPLNFSYAAIFDIEPSQFQQCDRLKVVATDYLGHEYTLLVEPTPLMKQFSSKDFLVLDGE
jgi:hypothetical protein